MVVCSMEMTKTSSIFASPFGPLVLATSRHGVTDCHWKDQRWISSARKLPQGDCSEQGARVLQMAETQLHEYFSGLRHSFDLPLDLQQQGTIFQCSVWKALQTIPYGTTQSYLDIAKAIDNPKAVRAVGSANNKNPVSIIVPCHRVIGTNGAMKGYAGGVLVKEGLLGLEGWKPTNLGKAV